MVTPHATPPLWTWALAAGSMLLAGLWMAHAGVQPVTGDLAVLATFFAATSGAGLLYATVRPAPILASACLAVALLLLFTGAAAVLSYGAVAIGAPLQDRAFAAMDAAIGFDWTAHLRFVVERPWLTLALTLAYHSCELQLALIVLGLAVRDRAALAEFMGLYVATAAAVVVVSALAPALGAYAHHAPGPELLAAVPDARAGRWHLEHFIALREGRFDTFSWRAAEGLISFPSFHTALGVIFARAFWRLPYLGAPGLVLNGLMIVSTLAIGGHYLVDIVAGAAIAFAAIVVLAGAPRRGRRATLSAAPSV